MLSEKRATSDMCMTSVGTVREGRFALPHLGASLLHIKKLIFTLSSWLPQRHLQIGIFFLYLRNENNFFLNKLLWGRKLIYRADMNTSTVSNERLEKMWVLLQIFHFEKCLAVGSFFNYLVKAGLFVNNNNYSRKQHY